ncbi:MAG: hypothetical protein NTZ05_05130 [Chloroflexi bacterium]|nr:hypothetical protein [Chloroflexota bacterium]
MSADVAIAGVVVIIVLLLIVALLFAAKPSAGPTSPGRSDRPAKRPPPDVPQLEPSGIWGSEDAAAGLMAMPAHVRLEAELAFLRDDQFDAQKREMSSTEVCVIAYSLSAAPGLPGRYPTLYFVLGADFPVRPPRMAVSLANRPKPARHEETEIDLPAYLLEDWSASSTLADVAADVLAALPRAAAGGGNGRSARTSGASGASSLFDEFGQLRGG